MSVEDLKVLYLTDEQVADLDAMLLGSIARYHYEINKSVFPQDAEKITFYQGWAERAEGLRTVLSAAKGPLPEDDDEDDDDE